MGHKRKKQRGGTRKTNKNVDDYQENLPIFQFSKLSICLEEEDDLPHPRHLCFRFPFAVTCPHLHCIKCYCYVCEEVAPCKEWSKSPIGHCHATAEDEIWRTERECRKNVPATNMTMASHILSVCFEQYPPDQPELINGFAGGLICDSSGDWVAGFSMHINNDIGIQDCSVLPYLALLEGLKLGWARGLRFLEVKLGFQYHEGFWADFEKDAATGKFDLLTPDDEDRVWTILLEVENCLNQDWFIDVKNTASFKEEAGATALAKVASIKPLKQIYDFPSHRHTATIKDLAKYVERNPQYLRGNTDSSNDLRIYAGLAP